MFKISKSSDYGLLLIEYLLSKNNFVSITDIVKKTRLPKRFLARIASILVNEGILESKEGKIGGYRVTDKLKSLSLYDYLKIFENFNFTLCSDKYKQCPWEKNCQHKNYFSNRLKNNFIHYLKSEKILKIIRNLK